MIKRKFPNILEAYTGLVNELAYDDEIKPLRWGVCLGFNGLVSTEIDDLLWNDKLTLGMASYTKSRWTRFLRRYFREDLKEWVDLSMDKLNKYPSRPFVASYSPNLDTGHNYGGCLSSLQIRINPEPEVILFSRACQIDKIGFIDLSLMNVIAREMGVPKVKGTWVISLGFISAISQIFYVKRFNQPTVGNRLARTMKRLTDVKIGDIKFGPLARGRKRMLALDEFGEIPRSIAISQLSIEKKVFNP